MDLLGLGFVTASVVVALLGSGGQHNKYLTNSAIPAKNDFTTVEIVFARTLSDWQRYEFMMGSTMLGQHEDEAGGWTITVSFQDHSGHIKAWIKQSF